MASPLETETKVSLEEILMERGERYGPFPVHAYITQRLKHVMKESNNWGKLSSDKKEALEMIAHKSGRILNGDPEYHDSWHDIAGYATLVADELGGIK